MDKDEHEWRLGSCSHGNEFPRALLTLRARLYLFNRTPFVLFNSCETWTSECFIIFVCFHFSAGNHIVLFTTKPCGIGMKDTRMAKKGNCVCAVGSLISIFVCFQDTEGNTGSFLWTLITDTDILDFLSLFFFLQGQGFSWKKGPWRV